MWFYNKIQLECKPPFLKPFYSVHSLQIKVADCVVNMPSATQHVARSDAGEWFGEANVNVITRQSSSDGFSVKTLIRPNRPLSQCVRACMCVQDRLPTCGSSKGQR
jgi:hypothetical protein